MDKHLFIQCPTMLDYVILDQEQEVVREFESKTQHTVHYNLAPIDGDRECFQAFTLNSDVNVDTLLTILDIMINNR